MQQRRPKFPGGMRLVLACGFAMASGAPAMTANPYLSNVQGGDRAQSLDCLTAAIYYEAGNEPLEGRAAVAQVVINRLRHPAYPKSVCGVVYQGASHPFACQFTFACDGSEARRPAARQWEEAAGIAAAALDGHVETLIGGATHYHADYVAPTWAKTMVETAHIGRHLFYSHAGGQSLAAITHASASPVAAKPLASAFAPWGLTVATLKPSAASVVEVDSIEEPAASAGSSAER